MTLAGPTDAPALGPIATPLASRRWGRISAGVLLVGVIVAIVVKRQTLADAGDASRLVSVNELLVLVPCLVALRGAAVVLHGASIPGLRWTRAAVVVEAQTAAVNTVFAGPGLALVIRIAMLRSWRVAASAIATSFFSTGLAPTVALWGVASAYAVVGVLDGARSMPVVAVSVIGPAVILGAAAFWASVLTFPAAARVFAVPIRWAQRVVLSRVRLRRIRWLADQDPEGVLRAARRAVLDLGPSRWALMFLAAAIGQLLLGVMLLLSAQAVGQTAFPDPMFVLRTFAVYRVLAGFVPVPGGIGVLDVAMISALTTEAGSMTEPEAVAGLALFRALTFVMPMVTGTIATIWWRARA